MHAQAVVKEIMSMSVGRRSYKFNQVGMFDGSLRNVANRKTSINVSY